ncbi:hypothetical protein HBN50_11675 [Halobacteriovorax sp. GB3]|uniref:hypothetical protein n=1 Tax=Halobacteriovorax sp. GB3 TaxID=2719615 RepID=UPI00235E73D1|nr:hypothetical protein [Halobacteriovorax sp. GB3]MDD0853760.1 hypothetical protein [Halobacteriovorax sp. GB3]
MKLALTMILLAFFAGSSIQTLTTLEHSTTILASQKKNPFPTDPPKGGKGEKDKPKSGKDKIDEILQSLIG